MKVVVAIICITILEGIALSKGINGTYFTLVVGAVAGLAGLATKRPKILERVLS